MKKKLQEFYWIVKLELGSGYWGVGGRKVPNFNEADHFSREGAFQAAELHNSNRGAIATVLQVETFVTEIPIKSAVIALKRKTKKQQRRITNKRRNLRACRANS